RSRRARGTLRDTTTPPISSSRAQLVLHPCGSSNGSHFFGGGFTIVAEPVPGGLTGGLTGGFTGGLRGGLTGGFTGGFTGGCTCTCGVALPALPVSTAALPVSTAALPRSTVISCSTTSAASIGVA